MPVPGPPTFVGGEVVKLLWNWLLPPLFGWPLLGFWQAVGLLALSRILFGSWCGGRYRGRYRSGYSGRSGGDRIRERIGRRMRERMEERVAWMTPEEREEFLNRLRQRWGGFEPPKTDPSA
jgi:hypothetical protein